MLQQLNIHNFTIIDSLEMDLHHGMHALTGETGAGKSISLDALNLVSGARADSKVIKQGQDRAEIHAIFDVQQMPHVQQWLEAHELHDPDPDNSNASECILRRVINRNGASRAYINGRPSALPQVQELASLLINIHGQHAQQHLLQRKQQRELFDRFAKATASQKKVAELSKQWQQLTHAIHTLNESEAQRLSQLELLTYQLDELEQLNLSANEVSELEQSQKNLALSDGLISDCQAALSMCHNEDSDSNVDLLLSKTLSTLAPYQEHSDLSNSIQLLTQAHILVTEANQELRQAKDSVNLDPEQLSHIETRLDTVYQLARKHHIDPQQLHTQCDTLRAELDALQNDSQQLSELEDELNATYANYQAAANKLSKLRRSAAKKLQKAVSEHLSALHMPSAELLVELEALDQDTPSPMGLENPQFLIRTNAGQAFGTLKQVASGGELSRISLAIEVATLATSTTPTLIFDEVDAGIGGATAEVVGDLLQRLGNSKQIICVTHQAQIAAKASHHYQVSKVNDDKNNRVQAFIERLNEADRVEEISRMIGGLSITKATREHAQEMLEPHKAIAS